MAWEWVAPICTAAVAVTSIGAAVYQNKHQARTSLIVARQQIDGQVAIAREERRQRRAEDAYFELLKGAEEVGQWAASVPAAVRYNTFDELWWRTRPELYFDKPAGSSALSVYWSPEIRALLVTMRDEMDRLSGAAESIREHTRGRDVGTVDWVGPYDRLVPLADTVLHTVRAIREQVAAELNESYGGTADLRDTNPPSA